MNSFSAIAQQKDTSLAVVAPGIAEALFATALGLAAAIPAVVSYNQISGSVSRAFELLPLRRSQTASFSVRLSRAARREPLGAKLSNGDFGNSGDLLPNVPQEKELFPLHGLRTC